MTLTLNQMPSALHISWQDARAAFYVFAFVFGLLVQLSRLLEGELCLLRSFLHPVMKIHELK